MKTGIKYNLEARGLITAPFAAVVDGITFGINEGKPFDSGKDNWTTEDKKKWAKANSIFFGTLSRNLASWEELLK
jgi:hypothetical protein